MASVLTPWRVRIAACVLLAIFVVQAMAAARRDSVTIDEFLHVAVGLYSIYTGDLSQDPIDPPQACMLPALALLRNPPAFAPEPGTPHWGLGYHLMSRNVDDYHDIFVRARSVIVLLAVLLGLSVFAWAYEMYGPHAALAATFLFSFSPAMLTDGHLATLDLSGALGFTATVYATWRLLAHPTVASAAVTGVAVAVATMLKLSGLVLIVVAPATMALCAWLERRRPGRPSFAQWAALAAVTVVVAIATLNVGYLFQGTLAPFSDAELAPGGFLAGLRESAPWLRFPLPLPVIDGIDMVLEVGQAREPSYFLAGELSAEGWWYYHLAAFALKTPIPLLVFTVVAMAEWLRGRSPGTREYALFLPILFLFVSNSLFNSLYIGVRHIIAVYPLLFIAVSPWVVRGLQAAWRGGPRGSRRGAAATVATAALLVWYAGTTLGVAPRYLQYFNELAGGPDDGHRWLIDSNIDWGQDLIRLHEYMESKDLPFVHLAYFGRVDPRVYGVQFLPLERESRGVAAVSATFLMGRPYFWYLGRQARWVPANTYTWLQEKEPIARVGSMFIYDLK